MCSALYIRCLLLGGQVPKVYRNIFFLFLLILQAYSAWNFTVFCFFLFFYLLLFFFSIYCTFHTVSHKHIIFGQQVILPPTIQVSMCSFIFLKMVLKHSIFYFGSYNIQNNLQFLLDSLGSPKRQRLKSHFSSPIYTFCKVA